ncbi:MAG: type II toxin-antitoxin system VapC family toxin [Cytophagales bacterium]|nr:type II toxin-antitoxin system VapC family toxin [Cytophagales bacterium]
MVAAPLHEAYREKVPMEIKDYFVKMKSDLTKQGIPILDFIDQPLENSAFKDFDHLNFDGARVFTKKLSDMKNPADNLRQGQ